MSNVHLNYLCNIAANSNGKKNTTSNQLIVVEGKYLDGTSPSPMLFTMINPPKTNDISSRHQQTIDAFLNDGKIFKKKQVCKSN